MSERVPVDLVGVRIQLPSNQPIVLLRERSGTRYLPIWIGAVEATAIAYALEGVESPRPTTHDLLRMVTEALGSQVERVVVTSLRDSVFYADLDLVRGPDHVTLSVRPSDALALAARTGSPIFATVEVLDDAGIELEGEEEELTEDEIDRFREFLDDIDPGDFEAPTS
jgi:bifunctional DNase/RNase